MSQKPATEIFPEGLWWLEVKAHGHAWVPKAHKALKLSFGPAEAQQDTPGNTGSPINWDKLTSFLSELQPIIVFDFFHKTWQFLSGNWSMVRRAEN